jgi:hypothetical protein
MQSNSSILPNPVVKGKFKFPHVLILLILIVEPNYNFLLLYNYNEISLLGFFKPVDILITLLLLYYFFFDKYKEKREIYFNHKILKYLMYFFIFYILYTAVISGTSNLLEAFKSGRYMLYISLFYIFDFYLDSKEIFHKYFLFLRYTVYLTAVIIVLEYFNVHILFRIPNVTDYGIPRIYFTHFTIITFILSLGVFQKIVGYSGEYKIKNIELIFCIFYVITSLTRSLWIATLGIFLIIQILSLLKIYSHIKIKNQIIYIGLILIFVFLFIGLIFNLGLQNTFLDRILYAENDIRYGEGTLADRIWSLNIWLDLSDKMGLQYTGLGFAHGYSGFIQGMNFMPSEYSSGAWGTEMGIGFALIYWGYIGTIAFHILIFKLAFNLMNVLRNIKNKLTFSIGISVSICILINFIFITWASSSILYLINIAFFLSFFNTSIRIFEINNIDEVIN